MMDILRPLRFAGVGGSATAAYWIVLLVLWQLDVRPLVASIIAYLVGFVVSYLGHRNITYRSRAFVGPELTRFFTMQTICLLLGNLSFWLVTIPLHLPVIAGGVALTIVSVGLSYVICEIWVFRVRH